MSEDSDERLHKARRSVQTATRQAYSALISSNETIINVDPSQNSNNTYPEDDDNDDDNNNTRAGMDLGLALFGTSTSYKNQIEQEFHNKLRSVEKELVDIQSSLDNNEETNGNNMSSMTSSYSNDNNNISMHTSNDDDNGGKFSSINDASQLQSHINFLQQCSKARKYLEDVDTLSLQTNFATSSIINNSSERKNNNNAVYSPSSICSSPSEFIKFAFDSPQSEGGGGGVKLSPMVQAAQLIKQTEIILDRVMIELKEGTQQQQGKENNANEDKKQQNDSQKMIQMQAKMLNELRHQTRQKKMELRHRAITLVDGCVLVETDGGVDDEGGKLIVRGSGTSAIATSVSSTKKKTKVAFDVGESPISTSTPTNNNDIKDDITPPPPPSPLSDAYQVLQIFSDDNYPTFGESLDGAMKRLSTKVLSVLTPCFTELKGRQQSHKNNDNKGGVNDKDVGYYKLTQESLKSVRSSSGSKDRRYDPVSIKGPAVQLQWTLVKLSDEKGSEAATDTLNDNIVTVDEINEQALQSVAKSTCAQSKNFGKA